MNFELGINKIKWQLLLIPTIALATSILIALLQSSQNIDFRFPLELFIILAVFIFVIWEVNLLVYRKLDNKLPFFENPKKRLIRQVAYGLLATVASFSILFLFMNWITNGTLQLRIFIKFLSIASGISFLINSLYIYQYLQQSIYYREAIKSKELNGKIEKLLALQSNNISTQTKTQPLKSILIEAGNKSINIPFNEIAYFISVTGVVTLVKTNGQKLTTNYNSFTMISDRLPTHLFFQLNRQFITQLQSICLVSDDVNRKLIVEISPSQQLSIKETVNVSRYRNPEFKRWFSKQLA
jgi:DNA-binding LytR/AlgR family response regulator